MENFKELFYDIISEEERTVEVVRPPRKIERRFRYTKHIKGDFVIPERAICKSKTYKVTSIGNLVFFDCRLNSVEIPNSVTLIGDGAFASSWLVELKVLAGNQSYVSVDGCLYSKDVTTLCCCPGAKTSINIPNSVTSIRNEAFLHCYNLKEIYCNMETPIATDEVLMNAVLYVPTGCKDEYEKVDPWRNFYTIKEFDVTSSTDTTISDEQTVTVEDGVIKVDNTGGQAVSVYDVDGTLVMSVKADGGSVEVAVPGRGVYIVLVGGKSVNVVV
jgi:hypothetical protein